MTKRQAIREKPATRRNVCRAPEKLIKAMSMMRQMSMAACHGGSGEVTAGPWRVKRPLETEIVKSSRAAYISLTASNIENIGIYHHLRNNALQCPVLLQYVRGAISMRY